MGEIIVEFIYLLFIVFIYVLLLIYLYLFKCLFYLAYILKIKLNKKFGSDILKKEEIKTRMYVWSVIYLPGKLKDPYLELAILSQTIILLILECIKCQILWIWCRKWSQRDSVWHETSRFHRIALYAESAIGLHANMSIWSPFKDPMFSMCFHLGITILLL